MINLDFLARLQREGKLELVSPSEDICQSYLEKSGNCLKSAKILLQNKLYDNSTTMSYYAMYNSLIALLFKIGITPTRRSCPIHGLKPVVFTDTRLDRRVGGMEKCAHPRTEVRGFRRHFFIKTIILFEALTILAMLSYYFFVPASTFEYTIVFDITDKGKTAGFDTTTESLVFGVLPRGAGATRFIDVETSSPQIIRIVPQGDFKGWM